MEKLLNSAKSDRNTLLNFIKYEVLRKKPIFDSFRNFCERMGPETMDYQEFEFWYMRFCNGVLDKDYDSQKKPLTFPELPLEIVDKIAKKLDPFDRIIARRVSKSLQYFIDRQKPTIDRFAIHMSIGHLNFYLKGDDFNNEDMLEYEWRENGCSLRVDREIQFEINQGHFMTIAFKDMMAIFSSQKEPMNHLKVCIDSIGNDEFIGDFNTNTEVFNDKLHVKKLEIECHLDPFIAFLKILKPGVLEEVEVYTCPGYDENFEGIPKMEQWKQAKSVDIYRCRTFPPEELKYFYHFEKFWVTVQSTPRDILIDLKNNIFNSTSFSQCQIFCDPLDLAEIQAAFGAELQENVIFRIPIPSSSETLLVQAGDGSIRLERHQL